MLQAENVDASKVGQMTTFLLDATAFLIQVHPLIKIMENCNLLTIPNTNLAAKNVYKLKRCHLNSSKNVNNGRCSIHYNVITKNILKTVEVLIKCKHLTFH